MRYFNSGSASGAVEQEGGRSTLEKIAAKLLMLFIFLLSIFFIPSVALPFQGGKALFVSLFVIVMFSLWVVARLKDGEFQLPKTTLIPAVGVIVVLFALAGIFSESPSQSFVGQGFEVGTVANILILSILLFLVPMLIRSKDRVFSGYMAFFASVGLLAFFHLLRFAFGPDFLSFGLFDSAVANTVGKWNDLGVFFGANVLLSLITIELIPLGRFFKTFLYLLLVVSLLFLAVINFGAVWFTLGLFSLIFLVYLISFSFGKNESEANELLSVENMLADASLRSSRRLPLPSLCVLLVSVIFILGGQTIGAPLSSFLAISQIEARPSWQTTFAVAKQTLIKDPLLGAGPNRFTAEWLKNKPAGINETIFWNVDFNSGIGLIPTFLVTTGILGSLSWVAFFILLLAAGFGVMLRDDSDKVSRYLSTSSFLVSVFLWIFAVVYIPSLTLFAIAFLFTGLFLSSLISTGALAQKTIVFTKNPRIGFVSVLILILLLIGGVTLGYLLSQKYVASAYFDGGVRAFNRDGDISAAERNIGRAAAISPLDIYFRFLTDISLLRMNTLLSEGTKSISEDSLRSQFQTLLGIALGNARQAVALNPTNYENFLTLGRVYEAVVPLGIAGAYESAKANYDQALTQNPRSPSIFLVMARLEVAKKDNAAAREKIARARAEKSNYTEAIFLLSQIEAQEGNIKAAISSVEAASVIAPDDPGVFFQLGLLRYNDRDYRGAAGALERAVALNPAYANAKYFLGLAYDRLNRGEGAIKQFEDLKLTNSDNKEVDLILRNLKAGRDPFSDAAPPVDDKPEKRAKLPVTEAEEE